MLTKIELNCDMGESLGIWRLAPDDSIMPHIDACNVAAGFHASDPSTLARTVALAHKTGTAIGAHPGMPDLVGFGRRPMLLTPEEVADIITYQVGAVQAFCHRSGAQLSHVKPHGFLYFYLLQKHEICEAAVKAIKVFNVPMYGLPGTIHESVCKEHGVDFVPEVFADCEYTSGGDLVSPTKSKPISPQECAERVRVVAHEGRNFAQGGSQEQASVDMKLDGRRFSVCLHSDLPGAVDNVKAVREMIDRLNSRAA